MYLICVMVRVECSGTVLALTAANGELVRMPGDSAPMFDIVTLVLDQATSLLAVVVDGIVNSVAANGIVEVENVGIDVVGGAVADIVVVDIVVDTHVMERVVYSIKSWHWCCCI